MNGDYTRASGPLQPPPWTACLSIGWFGALCYGSVVLW